MGRSNLRGRKFGCLRYFLFGGLLVAFYYVFRYEVNFFWRLFEPLLNIIRRQPVGELPMVEEVLRVLGYMGFVITGSIALAMLALFILAKLVLPVRTSDERWKVAERLMRSVFGRRSPLIVVREGKLPAEYTGKNRLSIAVAYVDLDSAIVLERQWVRGGFGTGASTARAQHSPKTSRPTVYVGRPGLVFIERGERLRGAVDLRKQFRMNMDVLGCTSEGIELKTNVFAIFALGYPATVLKVTYIGEDIPENLRVLQIDESELTIHSISDELDSQDKQEIHRYVQDYIENSGPSVDLQPAETGKDSPPYYIDDNRIIAAVYSQARDMAANKLDTWMDVPSQVATEVFRNMISHWKYDGLYLPDDPVEFPLKTQFKPEFARAVRCQGVMSYQFVQKRKGTATVGDRVDHDQFRFSPPQELHGSKVLRDRGIKVIHAGFSELKPTDPAITEQRLDNWRARWEQRAELTKADQDLELMRMRNEALAEGQREMITKLSDILRSTSYSEEALTLRVFQALEDIAADPETRQLLPRDTINMLRSLRLWLLPDEDVRPALLEENLSSSSEDQ